MKERWLVQTEDGDHSTPVQWVSLKESRYGRSVTLLLDTGSTAAVLVLSKGVFYLRGPLEPVFFRIESSARARIEGCMILNAFEISGSLRDRENGVLRELRKLLDLDVMEPVHTPLYALNESRDDRFRLEKTAD